LNDDATKRPTPHALLFQVLFQVLVHFVHSEVQLRFQVVDDLEVVAEVVAEVVVSVIFMVQCNYGGMLDAAITENGICGNELDFIDFSAISHSNGVSNVVGSEAGGHAWNGVA